MGGGVVAHAAGNGASGVPLGRTATAPVDTGTGVQPPPGAAWRDRCWDSQRSAQTAAAPGGCCRRGRQPVASPAAWAPRVALRSVSTLFAPSKPRCGPTSTRDAVRFCRFTTVARTGRPWTSALRYRIYVRLIMPYRPRGEGLTRCGLRSSCLNGEPPLEKLRRRPLRGVKIALIGRIKPKRCSVARCFHNIRLATSGQMR